VLWLKYYAYIKIKLKYFSQCTVIVAAALGWKIVEAVNENNNESGNNTWPTVCTADCVCCCWLCAYLCWL